MIRAALMLGFWALLLPFAALVGFPDIHSSETPPLYRTVHVGR